VTFLGSDRALLAGPAGALPIPAQDKLTLKLAMLYEGQCAGLGISRTAAKFGYSRQGYYKLLEQFRHHGANALVPGHRRKYTRRRKDEIVRAVVRQRFQHPAASAADLTLLLRQSGLVISERTIERLITLYGLQHRTYPKRRAKARA
jgi:transposase